MSLFRPIVLFVMLFFTVVSGSIIASAGPGSGGGGNLIIAPGITEQELRSAVLEARQPIESYLRFVEEYFYEANAAMAKNPALKSNDFEEFKNFFKPHFNIYESLSTVPIIIKLDGPCHDVNILEANGASASRNETDASAQSDYKDGICLSLPRLADRLKVDKFDSDRYKYEIFALLMHEYSHIAGNNEDLAKQVQAKTLEVLVHQLADSNSFHRQWYSSEPSYDTISDDFARTIRFLNSYVKIIPSLDKKTDTSSILDTIYALNEISGNGSSLQSAAMSFQFGLLRPEENRKLFEFKIEIRAKFQFLGKLFTDYTRANDYETYERIFTGHDQVKTSEYYCGYFYSTDYENRYQNCIISESNDGERVINKYLQPKDVLADLGEIQIFFDYLNKVIIERSQSHLNLQ